MDASTTVKWTRVQQCKVNAKTKSDKKRQAAFEALFALRRENRPVTKAAVARRAGVSVVFLRAHSDLVQAIEEAENALHNSPLPIASLDKAKDQVISALRRRLEEMKQQLVDRDKELRQKQREIDRLYGKLAVASPLTDTEVRVALMNALEGLTQGETADADM